LKHEALTGAVIGAFFDVYNTLGYGFLEKVYENALLHEIRHCGLRVDQQVPLTVKYSGIRVGEYFADLLVANAVIVEVKATRALTRDHEAQLLNYLKATRLEVGLLLNFGPKADVVRKVLDNDIKGSLSWVDGG